MATRWLFKTEPSVYSYQQLVKDKKTMWDGVANNLALMHLKDIKKGDQIFIYHTGDERQAVGIARALGGAYSDPGKDNPRMLVVDIEPVKALPKPVTLAEVKADKKLAKFDLVRNSRLSIMKLTEEQWDAMMVYDHLKRAWSYDLGETELEGLRVLNDLSCKYDLIRASRLTITVKA